MLPKRLRTAFCWDSWDQFASPLGGGGPQAVAESVGMWRSLGFNAVPSDGADNFIPNVTHPPVHHPWDDIPGGIVLSPAQRRGPVWQGLKYGVMFSAFGGGGSAGMGSLKALRLPRGAERTFNFSGSGLSPQQQAAERVKWGQALEFYAATRVMDVAYDGWFYQQDVRAVAAVVRYSQPDSISLDIEELPQLGVWAAVAHGSKNFARRKAATETARPRPPLRPALPSAPRGASRAQNTFV